MPPQDEPIRRPTKQVVSSGLACVSATRMTGWKRSTRKAACASAMLLHCTRHVCSAAYMYNLLTSLRSPERLLLGLLRAATLGQSLPLALVTQIRGSAGSLACETIDQCDRSLQLAGFEVIRRYSRADKLGGELVDAIAVGLVRAVSSYPRCRKNRTLSLQQSCCSS